MFTSSKVDEVGKIFSEDSLALTAWQPAQRHSLTTHHWSKISSAYPSYSSARLRPSGFSAFFGFATCRACRATAGFGGSKQIQLPSGVLRLIQMPPNLARPPEHPNLNYVWLYGYV